MARRPRKPGRPKAQNDDGLLLGEQGRIVLPKDVRARYGFKPGDRLRLERKDDGVMLRPAMDRHEALLRLRKEFRRLGITVDDLLRERRREAAREEREIRQYRGRG